VQSCTKFFATKHMLAMLNTSTINEGVGTKFGVGGGQLAIPSAVARAYNGGLGANDSIWSFHAGSRNACNVPPPPRVGVHVPPVPTPLTINIKKLQNVKKEQLVLMTMCCWDADISRRHAVSYQQSVDHFQLVIRYKVTTNHTHSQHFVWQ